MKGKRFGKGRQWCGNVLGEEPFDVYDGEFKDDYFHGEGSLHKANGESYVGGWRRGHRHGAFGDDDALPVHCFLWT